MSREVGMTFSARRACAIWLDEKWQTRRFSGIAHVPEGAEFTCEAGGGFEFRHVVNDGLAANGYRPVPRLRIGDVMVVREPWRVDAMFDDTSPAKLKEHAFFSSEPQRFINYSDEPVPNATWAPGRYRQAMHMPFAFARSKRVVTAVHVERLGDISEADARAEGVRMNEHGWFYVDHPLMVNSIGRPATFNTARACFRSLWDAVHHTECDAFHRDRRKWVWVYEFARRG